MMDLMAEPGCTFHHAYADNNLMLRVALAAAGVPAPVRYHRTSTGTSTAGARDTPACCCSSADVPWHLSFGLPPHFISNFCSATRARMESLL